MTDLLTDTALFTDEFFGYRPKMPVALNKRAIEEGRRRERPARVNHSRSMNNKYIPETLRSPEVLTLPFDLDLDGHRAPPKKPSVTQPHIPNFDHVILLRDLRNQQPRKSGQVVNSKTS